MPDDKLGTIPGDVVQLDADSVAGVDVRSRYLVDGTAPLTATLDTGGVNWANLRAAFMVDDTLYSGWSDGTFKQQSFDGNIFGPQTTLNVKGAYTGSTVSSILTGDLLKNNTSAQQGRMSSMFYDPRNGSAVLHATRDDQAAGPSGSRTTTAGCSTATSRLSQAWSVRSGSTRCVARRSRPSVLTPSAVPSSSVTGCTTSPRPVSCARSSSRRSGFVGSSQSVNNQADWRAKGLFLSTQPSIQAPNAAPTAAFTQTCVGLSCSFDGTGSFDSDGSVVSYSWNFGDGSPVQTGSTPNHVFPSANSYPVTLTVTDNDGAPDDHQVSLNVAPIASNVAFRASSSVPGWPVAHAQVELACRHPGGRHHRHGGVWSFGGRPWRGPRRH